MVDEKTLEKIGKWLGTESDALNGVTANMGRLLLHHIENPEKGVELVLASLSGALAGINEPELASKIAQVIPTLKQS